MIGPGNRRDRTRGPRLRGNRDRVVARDATQRGRSRAPPASRLRILPSGREQAGRTAVREASRVPIFLRQPAMDTAELTQAGRSAACWNAGVAGRRRRRRVGCVGATQPPASPRATRSADPRHVRPAQFSATDRHRRDRRTRNVLDRRLAGVGRIRRGLAQHSTTRRSRGGHRSLR